FVKRWRRPRYTRFCARSPPYPRRRGGLALAVHDLRPIGVVGEGGAVLVIVAADALIRRREGGARGPFLDVRLRWTVATLAPDADELRRPVACVKPAGQTEAGRMTLHAVGVDVEFFLLEHVPRVRVLGGSPGCVIRLVTR